MKVIHKKHMPNSGTSPKLLSRPWILHNTPRIIKDNTITQQKINCEKGQEYQRP